MYSLMLLRMLQCHWGVAIVCKYHHSVTIAVLNQVEGKIMEEAEAFSSLQKTIDLVLPLWKAGNTILVTLEDSKQKQWVIQSGSESEPIVLDMERVKNVAQRRPS
jgi:hypothetical protein